jgi:hypothetical protein
MCYEAAIASVGGDEATLTKSLIISLENTATNWYSRLPPKCIYSWKQLKEKFLLNFQDFQAKLSTKEDFLSYTQREKEMLPNFYRRFLQLKAQALKVSNNQVIAQAIKTLCVGPLHSHLVRERPKTVVDKNMTNSVLQTKPQTRSVPHTSAVSFPICDFLGGFVRV